MLHLRTSERGGQLIPPKNKCGYENREPREGPPKNTRAILQYPLPPNAESERGKDMIIDLSEQKETNENCIAVDRNNPEFIKSARKLSGYIEQLPLSHEQNDVLINMIAAHVTDAEINAYKQGLEFGLALKEAVDLIEKETGKKD